MFSYRSLEKKLGFTDSLPVDENWAAAADFLHIISDFCLQKKPAVIVECSSGISSLVLSRCCQINQIGHVYSLENGKEFVRQTCRQLSDYRLNDYCDVVYAPLEDLKLHGETYQWYKLESLFCQWQELESFPEIDMLVIDGPPGFLQRNSRYPAVPLLMDKMAGSSSIFLDDAAREDERVIVKSWLEHYPEFKINYIANERGCSILDR